MLTSRGLNKAIKLSAASKSSEEREKIKDSVQCNVVCVLCFFIRLLCAIKTDHMRLAFSHDC